jgi:hypothetical protein
MPFPPQGRKISGKMNKIDFSAIMARFLHHEAQPR